MLEKFKAIIFDMDGTLVDSGQLHEQAWTTTLNHFGIPVDRALMRSLAGVPSAATVDKLVQHFAIGVEASSEQIGDHKQKVVQAIAQQYVKPTALEVEARRFYGKKPMSIGTGASTGEATTILGWCGLVDLFEPIVGADQVAESKPSPDTFLRCAELMGVAPSDCVVLEDSVLGLEAAERAGMAGLDVLEHFGVTNDYFL